MKREEKALELIATLTAEGFTPYDISCIGKEFIKADGSIAILWGIEDVKDQAEKNGYPEVSDAQAMEILEMVEDGHDASEGITWDTLWYYTDDYFSHTSTIIDHSDDR
jgi:hypothetical protein